ncbi:DNA phosphorothioation-dependent restriction protein DptF [Halorarius litoreus]|uniref:DNA phosphorothioation-dependent restriction protein DptF n=1 Tax=Halorarius litoreus TaxID=2962676 RepID=UPI0020CED5A2|nr:DNA phosphorothioation-dependent restriction protein DptF [Halorarius litoreus]
MTETQKSDSLYELLKSCQLGESGSIVGSHLDRNQLRKELYVRTQEDELVEKFFVENYHADGKLLILTGSAGDGKSALLSRAYEEASDAGINALTPDCMHMDATASTKKHETYVEELSSFLDSVIGDQRQGGPRKGLAINLGLAIDFFDRQGKDTDYPDIWDAIDKVRARPRVETDDILAINLSHRQTYETAPDRLGSGLLQEIVERFDATDPESPFYDAYQHELSDCPSSEKCPLRYNIEQFADEETRSRVVELIAASSILHNSYLNPREILHQVSSILLPQSLQEYDHPDAICPIGRAVNYNAKIDSQGLIWNALFTQIGGDGDAENSYLDPAALAGLETDQLVLNWTADSSNLELQVGDTHTIKWDGSSDQIRTALRMRYLKDGQGEEPLSQWSWFREFAGALAFLQHEDLTEADQQLRTHTQNLFGTVKKALRGWTGSTRQSNQIEFVDGVRSTDYRFLSEWNDPTIDPKQSSERTRSESLPGQLWLVLEPQQMQANQNQIPVPIRFGLYLLMKRIIRGYSPNSRDLEQSEGIRLIHSRLSEFTQKDQIVSVIDKSGDELVHLERGELGSIEIADRGG